MLFKLYSRQTSEGAALIQQRPGKIHFTGSVKTGKAPKLAAEQLIPVDLELVKRCFIVFDVNMDRTVNGVIRVHLPMQVKTVLELKDYMSGDLFMINSSMNWWIKLRN
ncbi:MAG: hypothetical protein R2760_00140 [Chitinophagales bacterium]